MGYTSGGVAGKPKSGMRVELEIRNSWQLLPLLDLRKQKKPKAQDNLVEAGTTVSLPTETQTKRGDGHLILKSLLQHSGRKNDPGFSFLFILLSCQSMFPSQCESQSIGSLDEAAFRPPSSWNTEQ